MKKTKQNTNTNAPKTRTKHRIPLRIRKYFPQVKEVRDATKSILVSVEKRDAAAGRKKDKQHCALAKACMRRNIADGAIIGVGNTWLIKGEVATRYKTSIGVGREITSFDRHQDFAPGKDYVLGKISPSTRMGAKQTPRPGRDHGDGEPEVHKHKTINIRRK